MTRRIATLILAAFASASAFAADIDQEGSPWVRFMKGFDVGVRPVGRFGQLGNINVPPGDILFQLSGHLWYNHLIAGEVIVGIGATNLTLAIGGGFKVNLLELIEDPTAPAIQRPINDIKGIASPIMKNFMIFGTLDVVHYTFPSPGPGLTYDPAVWAFQPGVGAQWYFNVTSAFARRLYVETSIAYINSNHASYIMPFVALGTELK